MRSEVRQDLVSGDWILVAKERSKRPHEIKPRHEMKHPESGDPFENPEAFDNVVVKTYMKDDESDWRMKIIKNKYPLVTPGICGPVMEKGPFKYMEGVGFHEVFITRDPDKDMPEFSLEENTFIVRAFRDRFRDIIENDECQEYTLIFHNHGVEAGASLRHPHSQIISIPVYPPEVARSIEGAYKYFEQNKKKVHQVLVEWEMEEGNRTVYQNDKFIALCPYASKSPYEMRIYPKNFGSGFEDAREEDLKDLADALGTALRKLRDGLNDPAYNFYIHTSPKEIKFRDSYTWHIEILPKISTIAGFEMGTGIDVNAIDPEDAAELLRNA